MTRDEWIEAADRAGLERLKRQGHTSRMEMIADAIDAVEPLIRADERREVALDTAAGIVDPDLRAALRDEVLADLRAQVEALGIDCAAEDFKADILALLDGAR